jgi:hypothetical protein
VVINPNCPKPGDLNNLGHARGIKALQARTGFDFLNRVEDNGRW